MNRKCRNSPAKWLIGVVLIALGLGMILSMLLPYCVPLLAIACIAGGAWLIYHFKRC